MTEPRDPVEPDTADDAARLDSATRSRRGGRLRRSAATGVRAILVAAVLFALWVGVLWLTNPGPEASPGWERLADMPSARGEVASAATDDQLWVLGGLSGIGRTSRSVAVYDVDRDEWRSGPDLPSGRHHAAAATLNGDPHVSGGASHATDWTPRDQLWALAPGSATWEELEPMPEGRLGHDMVALEDRLYVVGGEDPDLLGGKVPDRHVVLAPGAERWEQAADPLLAVHGAAYGTFEGTLVIAGGASRQGVLSALAWTAVTQRVS